MPAMCSWISAGNWCSILLRNARIPSLLVFSLGSLLFFGNALNAFAMISMRSCAIGSTTGVSCVVFFISSSVNRAILLSCHEGHGAMRREWCIGLVLVDCLIVLSTTTRVFVSERGSVSG